MSRSRWARKDSKSRYRAGTSEESSPAWRARSGAYCAKSLSRPESGVTATAQNALRVLAVSGTTTSVYYRYAPGTYVASPETVRNTLRGVKNNLSNATSTYCTIIRSVTDTAELVCSYTLPVYDMTYGDHWPLDFKGSRGSLLGYLNNRRVQKEHTRIYMLQLLGSMLVHTLVPGTG